MNHEKGIKTYANSQGSRETCLLVLTYFISTFHKHATYIHTCTMYTCLLWHSLGLPFNYFVIQSYNIHGDR